MEAAHGPARPQDVRLLDGFVAPSDGRTGWEAAGRSPDGMSWTLQTVSNAGAHVMGAATYARWAGFWPSAPGPFAKSMNDIPKFVFSNSLKSADWAETTIVSGVLTDAVTRLKQERSGGTYLLRAVHASHDRWSKPAWSMSTASSPTPSSWVPARGSSPHPSPSSRSAPPRSAAESSPTSLRHIPDRASPTTERTLSPS